MTRVVISQPMYFPWVGFLAQLALADVLIWLDDAQFSKGSFTNRVQVKTASGQKWMSIPLVGKGSNTAIGDLQPATPDWQASHHSLLRNALSKAPWRDDSLTVLDTALTAPILGDALIASAEMSASHVGLSLPPSLKASQMNVPGSGWQRVLDLVQQVGGTRYITGHGARNYLNHQAFETGGIAVEYMLYDPVPWSQPYGVFTPYVTGLDLIANVPPGDRVAHLNPATTPWRDFVTS